MNVGISLEHGLTKNKRGVNILLDVYQLWECNAILSNESLTACSTCVRLTKTSKYTLIFYHWGVWYTVYHFRIHQIFTSVFFERLYVTMVFRFNCNWLPSQITFGMLGGEMKFSWGLHWHLFTASLYQLQRYIYMKKHNILAHILGQFVQGHIWMLRPRTT